MIHVDAPTLVEERALLVRLQEGKYTMPPVDKDVYDLGDELKVVLSSRQEGDDVIIVCAVVGRRFRPGSISTCTPVLRAIESERPRLRLLIGRYR